MPARPMFRLHAELDLIGDAVDRLSTAHHDVVARGHRGAAQLLRRAHHAEGVRSPAAVEPRRAALVLPVRLVEVHHVDAPDEDRLPGLDRQRRIDEITPYDVPAGMVVVRLDRPRPLAALAHVAVVLRRIGSAPMQSTYG